MKKGYLIALLITIVVSVMGGFKYEILTKSHVTNVDYEKWAVLSAVSFVTFFVPSFFIVRWYYKLKSKHV